MKGSYTLIENLGSLIPGDHVCIWDYSRWPFSYQHHGIIWKSGETPETIEICHVWSPLEEWREAQEDSCFRISTLKEFLYKRSIKNLRLVEYHTSTVRELLSRWGEVHFTKSDLPPIVLARCRFLLGLGRGEFNIFKQNCEHAAHWCMTGEQWCKQTLSMKKGKVPFEKQATTEQIEALENKISEIKQKSIRAMETLLEMSGAYVYLKVDGKYYVKANKQNNKVMVTSQAPVYASTAEETEKRYNELKNESVLHNDDINSIALEDRVIETMNSIKKDQEDISCTNCNAGQNENGINETIDKVDDIPRSGKTESKAFNNGEPTLFQLDCYSKGYNCIKVSFFNTETKRHMYSRSTFSFMRDIKLKKHTCVRGTHGLTWEYSPFSGYLKSMNQHRRYVGIQYTNGRLIDVSMRDLAATFEIVVASDSKQKLVKLPLTRAISHTELLFLEEKYDENEHGSPNR